VLLTGGYLVLDQQFSGMVLAVDAFFHSRVFGPLSRTVTDKALAQRQVVESPSCLFGSALIFLSTPQRSENTTPYKVRFLESEGKLLESFSISPLTADCERNKFAEVTIACSLMSLSLLCDQV
jgi:hypothetical protein